jgi:hypothetical protein
MRETRRENRFRAQRSSNHFSQRCADSPTNGHYAVFPLSHFRKFMFPPAWGRQPRANIRAFLLQCVGGQDFMASSKAHHATGFAAGVIAAALVSGSGGNLLACGLAMIAAIAGATAPDWLEVAWWSRARRLWITHRTLTHWGIGWVAMLAVSWHFLGHGGDYGAGAAFAFGFACGGLMHLLADWPNPLGVPWIHARHSLNLWTSGHCDLIVVGASWIAAFFVADDIWFHHAYGHMLMNALRTLHA